MRSLRTRPFEISNRTWRYPPLHPLLRQRPFRSVSLRPTAVGVRPRRQRMGMNMDMDMDMDTGNRIKFADPSRVQYDGA